MSSETNLQAATRPPLDLSALMKENAGKNYELQAEHINPANVKTLKTIGFDRCYTRAEGRLLTTTATEESHGSGLGQSSGSKTTYTISLL